MARHQLELAPVSLRQGGRVLATFHYVSKALNSLFRPGVHPLLTRCNSIKTLARQRLTLADIQTDLASLKGAVQTSLPVLHPDVQLQLGAGTNLPPLPLAYLLGLVLTRDKPTDDLYQGLEMLGLGTGQAAHLEYGTWLLTWYLLGVRVRVSYLASFLVRLRLPITDTKQVVVYGQFSFKPRALFRYWFERYHAKATVRLLKEVAHFEIRTHQRLRPVYFAGTDNNQ